MRSDLNLTGKIENLKRILFTIGYFVEDFASDR